MNRRNFLGAISAMIGGIALTPIIRGRTVPYVVSHKAETITPHASGRVVHRHVVENCKFVNVKAYGAKGDGVHDDTEALQAALDSTASYKHGRIIFPPGTYKVRPLILCA